MGNCIEGWRAIEDNRAHEDPEMNLRISKRCIGGNAGKVLVSPRNETLGKVVVLCSV